MWWCHLSRETVAYLDGGFTEMSCARFLSLQPAKLCSTRNPVVREFTFRSPGCPPQSAICKVRRLTVFLYPGAFPLPRRQLPSEPAWAGWCDLCHPCPEGFGVRWEGRPGLSSRLGTYLSYQCNFPICKMDVLSPLHRVIVRINMVAYMRCHICTRHMGIIHTDYTHYVYRLHLHSIHVRDIHT